MSSMSAISRNRFARAWFVTALRGTPRPPLSGSGRRGEELGEVAASHSLSARVPDESLFNQFAWLRERLKPSGLQTGLKPSAGGTQRTRGALDQLEERRAK